MSVKTYALSTCLPPLPPLPHSIRQHTQHASGSGLLVIKVHEVRVGISPHMSGAQKQDAAAMCGDAEEARQGGEQQGAQPGEEVPEYDADWGLETLVNVGEHWIDSLLQVLH